MENYTTKRPLGNPLGVAEELPPTPTRQKNKISPKFWYAVAQTPVDGGIGTYASWAEATAFCINPTTGKPFPGARFKKFPSWDDAAEFVKANKPNDRSTVSEDACPNNPSSKIGPNLSSKIHADDIKCPPKRQRPQTTEQSDIHKRRCMTLAAADDVSNTRQGTVEVYTDGSCLNNGKKGARGGVGVWFGTDDARNVSIRLKGKPETNQRAELTAIKIALEICRSYIDSILIIYSDSEYCKKCLTEWILKWKKNQWKTAAGTPVKNADLIIPAYELVCERGDLLKFVWVKGHSGNVGNDNADKLARRGADL